MANEDVELENAYAEKIALKNKLCSEEQMAQGKSMMLRNPGRSLLETLSAMSILKTEHVKSIQKMFVQYKSKNTTPGGQVVGLGGGIGQGQSGVMRKPATNPNVGPKLSLNLSPNLRAPGSSSGITPAQRPISSTSLKTVPPPDTDSGEEEVGELELRTSGYGQGGPSSAATTSAAASANAASAAASMTKSHPEPAAEPFTKVPLHDLLAKARSMGASDLHISVESPALLRVDGKLRPMDSNILHAADTEKLLFGILTAEQKKEIQTTKSVDYCLNVPGQGRYRCCVCKQRTGWDGAFRIVNSKVPTFEELGLPPQLKRLTEFHQGLVLVTGPNGCGKSTTMAAIVNLINQTRDEHIITIEDPVEYVYAPAKSHINQREVGRNTLSFSNALRAALREDPDVILIGELRDQETISLAITAAETGHLVFGTLHTTSAGRTIDRILDVFAPEEQGQIRSMISESIRGIVCQQLIPRKNGKGRALALEIMFNTAAAANLIRERKIFQLPSVLQTGKKMGMIPIDDSLLQLVNLGEISGEDAFFAAENKSTFQQYAPKA